MPEEKKYKTQFDGPWKDALDFAPLLFLKRFQEAMVDDIDVTEEPQSLDEELRQYWVEDEEGVRRVDRLLVFKTRQGDWLYVHIEVQCYLDRDLGRRVMSYRHRIRQRHGKSVVTIIVFGDRYPRWCPKGHREGQHGSHDLCRWLPIKLLSLAKECPDLENEDNPFSLFIAAHLAALATRKDPHKRQQAKIRLLSNLQRRSLDEADGREWYRLIDWLLKLPRELNRQVHQQLLSQTTEESMKYVSFAEREGRQKGIKEGIKEGVVEGARQSLRAVMKAKFGDEGLALFDSLGKEVDQARLEALLTQAALAQSITDIRPLFQADNGNGQPAP